MISDVDEAALDQLVGRTTGFRPWRKLLHAVNGLAIAAALSFWPLAEWQAVVVLGVVCGIQAVLDLVRLRVGAANRLFFRAFAPLVSPREAVGIASSTWYTLGVFVAVALFPLDEAVSAVLVLALADPAACWVGSRWGGRPLMGGTRAGTLAFFIVAAVVLGFRHETSTALTAASIVTLAERRAWPLDDNLAIPVVCAAVLVAIGAVP